LHRFDTIAECDKRTDRQTFRPWLRRAKQSAIERKTLYRCWRKTYGIVVLSTNVPRPRR